MVLCAGAARLRCAHSTAPRTHASKNETPAKTSWCPRVQGRRQRERPARFRRDSCVATSWDRGHLACVHAESFRSASVADQDVHQLKCGSLPRCGAVHTVALKLLIFAT